MTGSEFPDWRAKDRDASAIVDEAFGWAEGVDPRDDEAVLMWARHYMPRILAHGKTRVAPYVSGGVSS